ncbi:hypothetical protein AHAS_Ahas13G0087900 [Arachis hypogaea]
MLILSNRNLLVCKLDPPQTWNPMVENYLRATGFYRVSRIGVIRKFHPLLAALVERWRPETHNFVLPVGKITVILEDVAHIFGLPINGEHVSRWTDSSSDFLQSQSIALFGREPVVSQSSKFYIKLGWVRRIRDAEPLDTEESIRRYVRCQIFCILGSILFADKSTAYADAKYLPLLRDFERIHTYSWGQHVSHIFTEHYAVHHDMIQRRWMTLLICCLFGHGSECRVESFGMDHSVVIKDRSNI